MYNTEGAPQRQASLALCHLGVVAFLVEEANIGHVVTVCNEVLC